MNKQFENLLNGVELSQKWNDLALSNVEDRVAPGFDFVQESGHQQLLTAWSGSDEICEPAGRLDITQAVIRNVIESTRGMLAAGNDFQMEAQQLVCEQTAEACKLVEASSSEVFSAIGAIEPGARQMKTPAATRAA